MSSKFLIELGQGTVSVDGEEDFVKAAFCALQSILIPTGTGSETKHSAPGSSAGSKFLIELGQGTVSVDGEEEFVKAAFGALQGILTANGPAAPASADIAPTSVTPPATTVEKSGVEEFGSPGEILERIRDSLSDEDDNKKAVA